MTTIQIDQHGSTKPHQNLGTLLAPLFTWHGRDVYPVFGAEGDDDDSTGDGSADDDEEDADTGTGAADTDSGTVTQAEYDKILNRLKAADKNSAQALNKLKELEDGKKDELTKATERVAELEKQTAESSKIIADLRLQNAFLSADPGVTWHDPGDALALAERKGYLTEVVDDEGNVDEQKLVAKLKELAKAKPHLVKTGKDDSTGSSGGKGTTTTATGTNVGGKGKGTKETGPDLSRYSHVLNR